MCVCEGVCVCVCVCVYTTGKDIQIYTLWNNGSDFSQASKNPLRNKGKNKTNQKVTWAWIIFFCSLKTPGNQEALLMCLMDLLSISVLKFVFKQAYPKKMLLPNPVCPLLTDSFAPGDSGPWVEEKIQAEGTFPLGLDAIAAPGCSS